MNFDYSKKTDEDLMRLSVGNSSAFAELVYRWQSPLLRYVVRFSGASHECAEDIVQNSFLKIYKNLYGFDYSLKFSSWAYRITHNETLNHLRKEKNLVPLDGKVGDEDSLKLIEILTDETDIEKELSKKEEIKKIQKVLKNLSPDFREILVLKYLEDKSYDEISDILKKPAGTVATLIHRAKEQLKTLAQKNNLTI